LGVCDSKATDERGRVYSLLDVAKDFELVGTLDPISTIEGVYTPLVEWFIVDIRAWISFAIPVFSATLPESRRKSGSLPGFMIGGHQARANSYQSRQAKAQT